MPKHTITVETCHEKVPHRVTFHGRVRPKRPVQVYVFSQDGRWYKQFPATVKGSKWHTDVCCGFPESPSGSKYSVVAVTGPHVEPNRLEDFPEGVMLSNIAVVERE